MPTITPEEILASLDLDKVSEAILTDPDGDVLSFEFSDVKTLVVAAVNKWLIPDLTYIEPASLVLESAFTVTCGDIPTRGIIDLGGVITQKHYTSMYRGKRVVADWKTSAGALDKVWQDRMVDSRQWEIYAKAFGADLISYRGVSLKGVREVLIQVPTFTEAAVTTHFHQVGTQIKSLMDSGAETWPQRRPGNCGAYGQTCHFLSGCRAGTNPRFSVSSDNFILSYSGSERYLGCPEKFRLMTQAVRGVDGSDSTRLGGAFHRAAQEIWSQAFTKYAGKI